jgi:hypothetical protein
MLRTETVERTTLELLKTLMQDEMLKHFNLVGGTALALYMGHRKSIDLDLFSMQTFDAVTMEKHFNSTYGFENLYPEKKSNKILIGRIQKVKVDFVWDDSILVSPLFVNDGIRICSIYDIAAMKLKAILQDGTRLKDFVDVAFLSVKMSLHEMLDIFDVKYPSTSKILAAKAITYFNDIDFSVEIELIKGEFKWEKIEKRLLEMIKSPNKKFLNYPII